MKIKLLNAGGYAGLEGVSFPVEVNGCRWLDKGWEVISSDLLVFGADPDYWGNEEPAYWRNLEVEVVE